MTPAGLCPDGRRSAIATMIAVLVPLSAQLTLDAVAPGWDTTATHVVLALASWPSTTCS